jgi:hypothetical protein
MDQIAVADIQLSLRIFAKSFPIVAVKIYTRGVSGQFHDTIYETQ